MVKYYLKLILEPEILSDKNSLIQYIQKDPVSLINLYG